MKVFSIIAIECFEYFGSCAFKFHILQSQTCQMGIGKRERAGIALSDGKYTEPSHFYIERTNLQSLESTKLYLLPATTVLKYLVYVFFLFFFLLLLKFSNKLQLCLEQWWWQQGQYTVIWFQCWWREFGKHRFVCQFQCGGQPIKCSICFPGWWEKSAKHSPIWFTFTT